MKKTSIIKAKIKQAKRNKRIMDMNDRYKKLLYDKILVSVKVDRKYRNYMLSFINMSVKGKKLKKLKSTCKNLKIKVKNLNYSTLQKLK